ncbi:phage tail tip lysozyme [Methylobacterium sp. A49B]
MADEALRMRAEVVDAFSGPLKSLRSQLLDVSRQGASHGETLAKGMGKAEAAIQSTARSATTVLNPALATVGVTGLTAGAAVAGVAMSLNKLSSNLSSLGALSRETGVAAGTLQTLGAVARKFGLEQDAVASGTKTFAGNMREFSRGIGETYQWLNRQGTDAAGRKAFQDFAQDIRGTTDEGEKLRKSLQFMESIKNPVERGIFAQRLFGNADFGRLADGHLGKLSDVWNAAKERLGPLDPKALLQAEKFEQAIADLRTSMQTIGTTIAREVLPFASEFTQWIDGIAKDQRGDFVKGLRTGLQDISRELNAIDWKGAGESAKQMLLATTALVTPLMNDVKEIAAAIRSFNEGKYVESFRHLDGGSGPLARRLAPMKGDDEINAQEEVDRLRKLRDVANEASQHLIGRTQQRMGLIDSPEAAQQKLTAAEAELARLKARTPEERDRDYRESTEKLRRSIDGLSEQMKAQQGATAQKSSADGDGPFAGARVQTAGFSGGGFGRMPGLGRGANLPGGGSGPGYSGEQGSAGGRFNGLGGSRPRVESAPLPPIGSGGASVARGRLSSNQQEAYRAARAEGLSDVAARALVANMSGESLANPRDHHFDRLHMSQGIVQWDPPRAEAIRRKFGAYPKDLSVTDQTRAAIDEIRSNPRFRRTARALESDDPNTILGALVENFEAPQNTRRAIAERQRFYRGFRPDAAVADADRPRVAGMERPQASGADGEAWAAREKARKAFEAMQQGEGRLDASAGRAGIVAGPKVENNGSVTVNVQKAGPDARVTTSATGNLFRDIVQNHGRQMAKAD